MGTLKHYYKNREKILVQRKEYQTRPEVKERIKQYRKDNKEQIHQRHIEYESRPEVKTRRAEYWKEHQISNKKYPSQDPILISMRNKSYRESHKEEHKASNRIEYHKNPQKKMIKNTQWKKDHPKEWNKIVLKSQTKYLKSLSNELDIKPFTKIPYLYSAWSNTVKSKFGGLCQICYKQADHTHHIFHKGKYPKLSLNINNGIPLCIVHHNEVHFKGLK